MDELQRKIDGLIARADAIVDAAKAEARSFTDEENAERASIVAEIRGTREVAEARAEIDAEARKALPELQRAVAATEDSERKAPATPRSDEARPVYGERSENSFFLDVVAARSNGDEDARQRQAQNRAYTAAEMEKRDLGNIANKGSEAIVPLYMQDKFEAARVAKAITSGLTSQQALPTQGDTITIPKQTGSAAVASLVQADPLNTIQETNAAFDVATASVLEIAGSQDLSNYLVDRGTLGVGVDVVIGNHLSDLLAKDEDQRVIAAAVAAATASATYTATTGTLVGVYKKVADVVQQIHTTDLDAPTAIVVHPRRLAAWVSELDASNRPLVSPMAVAQNPLAYSNGAGEPVAQGFSGFSLHGLPIYVDANIATTDGAGTNQDSILLANWGAQYTWMGPILVDLDRSVMFKQSGMTVRARRYFATMAAHRPAAFGKITGTGLATPTFA